MKRVSFLGLPSCSWCKALKKELDDVGVSYEFVDVNGESKLADFVEDLLEVENYPIVIVQDDHQTYYIYRAEHVYEVGEKELKDGSRKYGTLTLAGLVEGIQNYINK
jgi:glutaredoxin